MVDEAGKPVYRTDMPISRDAETMDNGEPAPPKFGAPQPRLFSSIIEGILGGRLEWALVIAGALIAVALEFCGVSALPVAVGMYLALASTMPIFIGGLVRFAADWVRGKPKTEAEAETSPGILLASGYIAGGTLCGLFVVTVFNFWESLDKAMNVGLHFFASANEKTGKLEWNPDENLTAKVAALATFVVLAAILWAVGKRRAARE